MAELSVATWDTAAMEAADDSMHKKRVQGIMEAALAKALNMRIEGKMSQADWDAFEAAVQAVEQQGQVNIATINSLVAASANMAVVTAATARLKAVSDAMAQAVAAATVANSTPSPVATGATGFAR